MKRYLIHFAIASILFASLIVSVNWIIDPYGIYRTSNQLAQLHKPLLIANERVFKTVRLAKNPADIILLGTSRADLGLGSHYPQFIDKKVINLATYAQSIEESKNLILQYVKQNPENPPDQIFLGLDFFAFNALLDFPSDYDEENFSASRRWQLLLSISSLADVSKYFANHDLLEMNACCDQDGFRYQLSIDQLKSHYRAGFDKYVKGFLTEDKWLAGQECRYSHQNNNGRNTLEVFRALLRMAYDHRINLKLFISPAHAWLWETLNVAGLWSQWEAWKTALVLMNQQEAARAGQAPLAIWDFSGYDTFSTESVPSADEHTRTMQWYLDSSHYSPRLGEHIIARMTGTEEALGFANWGALLSTIALSDHYQRIRQGRDVYEASHAQDLQHIMSIARQVEQKRHCPFKFQQLPVN